MRRGPDRRASAQPQAAGGAGGRIRLMIIEDNRLMRDGLARVLGAFGDVEIVAAAESAASALEQARDARPDVALVDAALANNESHAVVARLKAAAPNVRTVVMDFVPARQDVTQFIEGGVKGFIMKDATAEDLVKAVRTVHGGAELPLPAAPRTPAGDGEAAGPAGTGTVRLTKREQEIRELIAQGLGNKEIAQRLNIATNTVKSHVHNMLGKLATLTPPDRRTRTRTRRGTSRRSYRFTRDF